MISRQLLRFPIIGCRAFSVSASMAAEVRRLGVVGAGQMVGLQPETHETWKCSIADCRRSGIRHSTCCSSESSDTRYHHRQLPGFDRQGPQVCGSVGLLGLGPRHMLNVLQISFWRRMSRNNGLRRRTPLRPESA